MQHRDPFRDILDGFREYSMKIEVKGMPFTSPSGETFKAELYVLFLSLEGYPDIYIEAYSTREEVEKVYRDIVEKGQYPEAVLDALIDNGLLDFVMDFYENTKRLEQKHPSFCADDVLVKAQLCTQGDAEAFSKRLELEEITSEDADCIQAYIEKNYVANRIHFKLIDRFLTKPKPVKVFNQTTL